MLTDALYMSCDLPSTLRALEDPELFLGSQEPDSVLILDEVHYLDDPSRLLKIAADEYPRLKVLATGSSTLAATRKFRDSRTGRKQAIHLCPVLWEECAEPFGVCKKRAGMRFVMMTGVCSGSIWRWMRCVSVLGMKTCSTGRTNRAVRWILLFAVAATGWMPWSARLIPTS